MNLFIDTSSLVKLYHSESDTTRLDKLFEDYSVSGVFLSEITKIEFDSAVWKKVRVSELTFEEAINLVNSFESDYKKYCFIKFDNEITGIAKALIARYGNNGLRTLDSIQLSSALKIKTEIGQFVTSDKLLGQFALMEGLTVY